MGSWDTWTLRENDRFVKVESDDVELREDDYGENTQYIRVRVPWLGRIETTERAALLSWLEQVAAKVRELPEITNPTFLS